MGNFLGRDSDRENEDGLPTGRPDNSYWRQGRKEKIWHLREALLDGNAKVACRLLGSHVVTGAELDGPAAEGATAQSETPQRARCCGMMPMSRSAKQPSDRVQAQPVAQIGERSSRAPPLGATRSEEAVEQTGMPEGMPEDYHVTSDEEAVEQTGMPEVMPEDYHIHGTVAPQPRPVAHEWTWGESMNSCIGACFCWCLLCYLCCLVRAARPKPGPRPPDQNQTSYQDQHGNIIEINGNGFGNVETNAQGRSSSWQQEPGDADDCSVLDLHSYRWEDDNGMSALHYLALGRRHTPYARMQFNFPAVGPHAARGLAGDTSVQHRKRLLLLLLSHGRLTPYSVQAVNAHGANPLHAAACVGDSVLVETLIRKADAANECLQPTFGIGAVDSALAALDSAPAGGPAATMPDTATSRLPVDVATSFGHPISARLLGLGLLSNIPQVLSFCGTLILQSSLADPLGQGLGALAREDSDVRPSSWALVSEGSIGAVAEQSVKVLKNDEARLQNLQLKERQLAAQLGLPLADAGRLLARNNFDLESAVTAHQESVRASQEGDWGEFLGDGPLEIVHTTHDDVRVDVFEGGGGGAAGRGGQAGGGGGGGVPDLLRSRAESDGGTKCLSACAANVRPLCVRRLPLRSRASTRHGRGGPCAACVSGGGVSGDY